MHVCIAVWIRVICKKCKINIVSSVTTTTLTSAVTKMAMDKLTKYFVLFIGPMLIYITISLYLKDEDSLSSHTKIISGQFESGDRSRDDSQMIGPKAATNWNIPEHLLIQQEKEHYDEKSERIKKELKRNKSEQLTKLHQQNLIDLPNNFVEDFSFDHFTEYIQPNVDAKFHKEHENKIKIVQKTTNTFLVEEMKDSKNNNKNRAPPSDRQNQKPVPKSSVSVRKEPDIKWCHKKRIRLLILVFTKPEHNYERFVARKSWIINTPNDFAMLFVMGKPDDTIIENVNQEFENFQDILIGNFKDQKRSETTKFMMALMWFSQLQNVCKVPRYVLKTADNIYINMAALSYWIKNELPMTKNLYLGRVVRRDEPVRNRNDLRYVPRSAFQDFVFPDYLNGPQYLFSADVMHRMAYVTRLVFPIAVEDAYIGLLCHRLEIRPIWDENFHLLMKTTNICVNAKLLFIFCKSAKEMSRLHKEINNSKRYLQCKPLPRRGIHIGL